MHVFFEKMIEVNKKLDATQKIIRNLFLLMIVGFILFPFLSKEYWKAYFVFTLLYWTFLVFACLIGVYKRIYQTTLGKGAILLVFTLCANFSFCLAGIFINDITSVSPINFPHVLIFISITMIPLIVPVGMFFIFIVLITTATVWVWFFIYDERLKEILFPGYQSNEKKFLYKTTFFVNIVSVAIYCVFIFQLAKITLNDYVSMIHETSQSLIYRYEMFDKSQCKNINKGKVAFINDDYVLVAEKLNESYTFKVLPCKYEIEK